MNPAGGILLLDKPLGLSSNAALQRARTLFGRIKGGHTGSLDPLATGMLPICLGEATKIAGDLLAERKCYRFTLRLGSRTATGDAEGEVVETAAIPALTLESARAVARQLLGEQSQVPPMYSALKRGGQPLYVLARQGIEVPREARRITILALEVLAVAGADLDCRVVCTKGTYVRTLGETLGGLLGSCGHLASLRREFVEPFEGERMWTLPELEQAVGDQRDAALLGADRALPDVPAVHLDGLESARVRQGQRLIWKGVDALRPGQVPGRVRLYDDLGRFFGLAELEAGGRLQPRRLLAF